MTTPTCRPVTLAIAAWIIAIAFSIEAVAAGHTGRITFSGTPVPGVTVTARKDDQEVVVVSDADGIYRFADLAEGVWRVAVSMHGFVSQDAEVTVGPDQSPRLWSLALMPFAEMARGAGTQAHEETTAALTPPTLPQPARNARETRRVAPNASSAPAISAASTAAEDAPAGGGLNFNAADGLLINGSVNNGAASPFAQLAAFGNNRRGRRSLYNGGLGIVLGNSSWDARPFSFSNQRLAKPSYDDVQVLGTFSGPIALPRITKNGPVLYVGYQRNVDHSATTQAARVPTARERGGDFSQSADAFGRPLQLTDPTTGLPFADNRLPQSRLSPQAAALLNLYPAANLDQAGNNFQASTLSVTHQDSVQTRATQSIHQRDALFGALIYQRTRTDGTNVFAWTDASVTSTLGANINWQHRLSPQWSWRARYEYARQAADITPFFSGRRNVSGEAGISGNDQTAANWGPPNLTFADGLIGFSSPPFARTMNDTHTWSGEIIRTQGRHTVTMGAGVARQRDIVDSQQDARGSFAFTGSASGSPLADFLLGIPSTSAIAFGNADKHLHAPGGHAYVVDDWRVSPSLTLNLGARWEYEAPMTEEQGRLVNLDVAPGFTAASPVVAGSGRGALTGTPYPASLLFPDRAGVEPRLGAAWRPVAGSSLVVRGGYGVYRNTGLYQTLALLMAQQPPFSKTSTVANSDGSLTLANGFATPAGTANTFAIDPHFRVGDAHNWQASVQRDLPASLTIIGTYLGTAGRHLMQEFLPNTYPIGATNPCPTCPSGFIYLASNGTSLRNAGQVQLRRRLRNGLSATLQYTLAKATDNASAFVPAGTAQSTAANAGVSGATIAQDWHHLEDEYGPSTFDQRHLVTGQFQYTTGMGLNGGALLQGLKGRLFKGWTIVSQVSVGSGFPQTPIYLAAVPGTGITGTIRARLTGASDAATSSGDYANPAAYGAPLPGQWGTAGRNSIVGPAQLSLNGGLGRSFLWRDRYTLDWRLDASNLLNTVTYAGLDTIIGSPQFGRVNRANTMRKVQTSVRLRF